MNENHVEDTIAVLDRMPAALDALLRGLPERWTAGTEGADTWSVTEVIAHLIHGERTDWMPRVTVILERGPSGEFVPFDRQGHRQEMHGKPLAALLDEFAGARTANLSALRALNLTAGDLSRTGRHPAFGTVTLSQLLATWAAHDLTHLHQISRIMAVQYRELVGPWTEYLGVMNCSGHSSPPKTST